MSSGVPISDELRPVVSASHWLLLDMPVAKVWERIGRTFAYLTPGQLADVIEAALNAQAAGAAWHAGGLPTTLAQAVPALAGQPVALVDVRLSFKIGTGANARTQYITYRDHVSTGASLDEILTELRAVAEAWSGEYGGNATDFDAEIVGVF